MRGIAIGVLFVITTSMMYAQHNHLKELGLKGKIKTLTCIYYKDGQQTNGRWAPKDSVKFTYKTITYYNRVEFIDSIQTYVNHGGKQRLISSKRYQYDKNSVATGTEYNYLEDVSYNLTLQWLDHDTYIEEAKDVSGGNSVSAKIYLDNKFHIIKREDIIYRDGELIDHTVTETKFNPDNTEHAVSITENKINHLEFSSDEYIEQRDATGNAIKKTYKDGVSTTRSIKYYIIEYYE